MAAPNIVNVSLITAKTAYLTPANTTVNVLLANAASSGKVFKVNMVIAANVDGTSAYDTTVAVNTAAAGSGTSYPLASTVSVPADASLIVSDKSTAFYLEEDKSIVVTSSTASKFAYTVSYEELS
jgi:hypothetical protein